MKKAKLLFLAASAGLILTACGGTANNSSAAGPISAAEEAPYRKDEILALRQGTDVGFKEDTIGGSDITKDCEHKGTITKVNYETYPYAMTSEQGDYHNYKVTKGMNVYTPYGYNAEDKETKYDVLILCHGSGENEDYWFAQGNYDPTDVISSYLKGYGTQQVLDNMMDQGLAAKTIVVTPSLYTDVEGFDTFATNSFFAMELKNDILPYIAEHYNTYAASSSAEDLKAARDHYGYAGLSYGGAVSLNAAFSQCFEYLSYIGTLSISDGDDIHKSVVDTINEYNGKLKCNYWFNTIGLTDGMCNSAIDGYLKYMSEAPEGFFKPGSDLSAGCNVDMVLVNKTGHSYACWLTALYNMMLVFFKA